MNNDQFLNPEVYQNYKRTLLNTYKKIFKGTIKESFLISIYDKVDKDPRYSRLMLEKHNPVFLLSMDAAVCGHNYTEIDTCKMIVMNHYMNTVSKTDQDRGKLQDDSKYREKLVEDVIKMCSVQKLVSPSFTNSSLEGFLPIIYYSAALNNFLANNYDSLFANNNSLKGNQNKEFNSKMIYKIIYKIRSCVCLADIEATDELMIIFRSLIELFMSYVSLWDEDKEAIDAFFKFDQASFDYNYDSKITDEIKVEAKHFKTKRLSYLNYGWIKDLKLFETIKKENNPFSLSGLAKLLDKKYDYIHPRFGSDLYMLYRSCNPQTHGTSLMMNYFDLEIRIFHNIGIMLKFISDILSKKLFEFECKYNDLDLLGLLNTAIADAYLVQTWLHQDETNLTKTNCDYRNRALCSIHMKTFS